MEKTTLSSSLLQSNYVLCFSLIYLLSAVYLSLSSTKCIFRSPSDHHYYFSYPSSYGEHKYAIPTTRSTCNSPLYFSDYSMVSKKMQKLLKNSTLGSLRYIHGDAHSFGGNFSLQKRLSYFDPSEDVPCGFFRRFPISNSDQISMEECDGLVVVSAIFNDHDKIRQPKGLGPRTLDLTCFFMFVDDATLESLHSHNLITSRKSNDEENKIGVWRIVRVWSEKLYNNGAMSGVVPKHLIHRLFPNAKYSIWADAKLQLVIDPLLLVEALVVREDVDMAISKHPHFVHTMDEASATARWKKWWDVKGLKEQMETYCDNGLEPWSSNKPYPTDVPDSALILRKHSATTNLFSCLLFNELEAFNPRDQLPFAFVRDRLNQKLRINMFEVEVFEQIVVEYRHNLKHGGPIVGPKFKLSSSDLFGSEKCEGIF